MHLKKLLNKAIAITFVVAFVSSMFSAIKLSSALLQEDQVFYEQLAYRWAPIWYQNTDDDWGDGPRLDYITRFDFDGDWWGSNNYEYSRVLPLKGYVYYSVVESGTHWFLVYAAYHAKDWYSQEYQDLDTHENDVEGALVVVDQYGAPTSERQFGRLEVVITYAHDQFYTYVNNAQFSYLSDGEESIDGFVQFEKFKEVDHPVLFVQSGGHGVYGLKKQAGREGEEYDWLAWNWGLYKDDFPDGDGVIYKPSGDAEVPSSGNDRDVGYALIDMSAPREWWDRRYSTNGEPFVNFGEFYGGPKAPWRWDDNNDGPVNRPGEICYNPADLVDVYLAGLGDEHEFSHWYEYNPYAITLQIDWYGVCVDKDWEAAGQPDDNTDAYLKVRMQDGSGDWGRYYDWRGAFFWDGVLDGDSGTQNSWVGENIPEGTGIYMHTELVQRNWWERSEKNNHKPPRYWFYGIDYPGKPLFGIESRDWDPLKTDDWLMGWVDEDNHFHEVSGMREYWKSEIGEGQKIYDWGGSMAYITVTGSSIDDDVDPPTFWGTYTQPKGMVPLSYVGRINFYIYCDDASGISTVRFGYRGTNTDWAWRYAYPMAGGKFCYSMEKETWDDYEGQVIYYRWIISDDDEEGGWHNDMSEAYTPEYRGPSIQSSPPVGECPSADGDIIAFQTDEWVANEDLKGDGAPLGATVIRYLNATEGTLTNTGVDGERPYVSGSIIAFCTDEKRVNQDLNNDQDLDDHVLQYYEIPIRRVTNTEIDVSTSSYSINEDNIVFMKDGWTMFYHMPSAHVLNTTLRGSTLISGDIMVLAEEADFYGGKCPVISYYNVSAPEAGKTTICDWDDGWPVRFYDPQISGNTIAFIAYYPRQDKRWLCYKDVPPHNEDNSIHITSCKGGNDLSIGRDVVAFLTYEGWPNTNQDLTGDRDTDDYVLQYYDISCGTTVNTGEVVPIDAPNDVDLRPSVGDNFIAFVAANATQPYPELPCPTCFVIKYVSTSSAFMCATPDPGSFPIATPWLPRALRLSYSSIWKSGTTSVTAYDMQDLAPPPPEFTTRVSALEIQTTAGFVEPIQLRIPYDPTYVANELNLTIMVCYPDLGSQWREISSEVDTQDKCISAFLPLRPERTCALPVVVAVMEAKGPYGVRYRTTKEITTALGGRVTSLVKTTYINIPQGILSGDSLVSIDVLPLQEEATGFLHENWQNIACNDLVRIDSMLLDNPSTASYLKRFASASLTYDETKTDETNTRQLQVYFSTDHTNWQKLQISGVDTEQNTVNFLTDKFGEFIIIKDAEPPTTAMTTSPPKYVDATGNIFVSSATLFTLTATDTHSGWMYSYYRINAGTWNLYEASFNLTGPSGIYTIDYYTIDFALNRETSRTLTVILDNEPPSLIIEIPLEDEALQDGITFQASASDVSGVALVTFSIQCPQGNIISPEFQSMPATLESDSKWNLYFDTRQLPDGFYLFVANGTDVLGNWATTTAQFSIRNWATIELLPTSENNKAGRTMPVKFSIRVKASVDPSQPFIRNEELAIRIYEKGNSGSILQSSTYGATSRDYRIDPVGEKYITNFKTLTTPKTYVVEIYRKDMLIGTFEFKTVK